MSQTSIQRFFSPANSLKTLNRHPSQPSEPSSNVASPSPDLNGAQSPNSRSAQVSNTSKGNSHPSQPSEPSSNVASPSPDLNGAQSPNSRSAQVSNTSKGNSDPEHSQNESSALSCDSTPAPRSTRHYRNRKISLEFLRSVRTQHTWLGQELRRTTMCFVASLGACVPKDELNFRSKPSDRRGDLKTHEEDRQYLFCVPCRAYLVDTRAPLRLNQSNKTPSIEDLRKIRKSFGSKYSFAFGLLIPTGSEYRKGMFKFAKHASTKQHENAELRHADLLRASLGKSEQKSRVQFANKNTANQLAAITLLQMAKHGRPISAMTEALQLFEWQLDILQQRCQLTERASLTPRGWSSDNNRKLTRCLTSAVQHLKDGDFDLSRALGPGFKALIHDGTTHRRQNYLGLAVRHLNKDQTRAVNTFVGLTTAPRLDAEAEGSAIVNFISGQVLAHIYGPERTRERDTAEILQHHGLLAIGRDGASVNGRIDSLINKRLGCSAHGYHCACHRSHLVTTRNTKKSSKCAPLRDLSTLLCTLVTFLDASSVRLQILKETQELLDLDPTGIDAWSPTRMNHFYATNSQVLQRIVAVVAWLQALADERPADRAKANGLLSQLTSVPTLYTMHLLDTVGSILVKQTKQFDSDDMLVAEVFECVQSTLTKLHGVRDGAAPKERLFFECIDKQKMIYSNQSGTFAVRFPGGRRAKSWESLQRVKQAILDSIVGDLEDLYPNDGMERMFALFNLRTLAARQDPDEEEEQLIMLCDRYAVQREERSELLACDTTLPALVESGGKHIEVIDEWFQCRPDLTRLSKSVVSGHLSHADAFEIFLGTYRHTYPRICVLIVIMLIQPVNSSIIERVFSHLKELVNPKRARLDLKQVERLLLLKLNLPSNLEGVSVASIVSSM